MFNRRSALLLSLLTALVACGTGTGTPGGDAGSASTSSGSSGSSSGSSGSSSGSSGSSTGPGFDCPALRDKQVAANCPKFDPVKYLGECEQTKTAASACKPTLDAYANCVLGQPIGCTASGTIDDNPPAACKAEATALDSCLSGDAGK